MNTTPSQQLQHYMQQAFAAYKQNSFDHVYQICEAVLKVSPKQPDAMLLVGLSAQKQNRNELAVEYLKKVIKFQERTASVRYAYARALVGVGKDQEAVREYQACLAIDPKNPAPLNGLAMSLYRLKQSQEASKYLEKLVSKCPDSVEGWANLGLVYNNIGKRDQSLKALEKSLALNSSSLPNASNYLLYLNYGYSPSLDEVANKHKEISTLRYPVKKRALEFSFGKASDASERGTNKLRLGFVSPDMHRHSVTYFFCNYLQHIDRSKYALFVYYNEPQGDEVTESIKHSVDGFHYVRGLNTDTLHQLIRNDGIDILVDLAGHSANNRLDVFAQRSAPIQVAWLGYPNTTGLPTVDYRVVDEISDPQGQGEQLYSEELVRLPGGFLTYKGEEQWAQAETIPFERNGKITFGSFNNSAKISPESFNAWAEILLRVGGAQLLLKSKAFGENSYKKEVLAQFKERGIVPSRLKLLAYIENTSHAELYNDVDIALDTFPYNGTTTTCEALWMGVPVLTFAGDRHASRVSASILQQVALSDFVADDEKDYIEKAVSFAAETAYLQSLKQTLRQRMLASTLCDGAAFAKKMDEAFEWMVKQKS